MMSDETTGSGVTPRIPRYRSLSASSANSRFTSSTVVGLAVRQTISATRPDRNWSANRDAIEPAMILGQRPCGRGRGAGGCGYEVERHRLDLFLGRPCAVSTMVSRSSRSRCSRIFKCPSVVSILT